MYVQFCFPMAFLSLLKYSLPQANFKHQGLDADIEMSRVAGGVVRKTKTMKQTPELIIIHCSTSTSIKAMCQKTQVNQFTQRKILRISGTSYFLMTWTFASSANPICGSTPVPIGRNRLQTSQIWAQFLLKLPPLLNLLKKMLVSWALTCYDTSLF